MRRRRLSKLVSTSFIENLEVRMKFTYELHLDDGMDERCDEARTALVRGMRWLISKWSCTFERL